MKNYSSCLLTSILILMLFYGNSSCKKHSNGNPAISPTVANSNYTISVSGYVGNALEVGYSILFYINAPAGSSVSWNFGDGMPPTGTSHIYSYGGSYTVTALVNNDSAHIASKTISISYPYPPPTIQVPNGSYKFHHIYYSNVSGVGTTIIDTDETISVVQTDPYTITLFNVDKMKYNSGTDSTVGYGNYYYPASYETFSYNSNSHTMIFFLYSHISPDAYSTDSCYYP